MTSKVEYKGNLRTEALHLKSNTRLITDAPVDNNGKGEAYSPTDLVATALASCALTVMGIKANSLGFDLEEASAEIEKIMAASPRRISEVKIEISLKQRKNIETVLPIIEKAIPYHIIFIITIGEELFFRTAKKHPHPTNPDNSIIDWVFSSNWINKSQCDFSLHLKVSVDSIYQDFCSLISDNHKKFGTIANMIEHQSRVKELTSLIEKLESKIKKSKQFNKKIEMNIPTIVSEILYLVYGVPPNFLKIGPA